MHLQSLHLKNFRNYSDEKVEFHPAFNFIFGNNAQGKTNLLEAIYFLGHLKSFRTSSVEELVLMQEQSSQETTGLIEASLIEADFQCEGLENQVRIVLENGKKGVWLNQKRPSLYQDYYGLIPVVLFEPWEVYLFRESPSHRRKFLDRGVFLDNSSFLKIVREYETVVSQKNRLLKDSKGEVDATQLGVWNEKLASLGAEVISNRLAWIEKINRRLTSEYQLISNDAEEMLITYLSTLSALSSSKEELYRSLIQKIEEKGEEEIRRRETLIGPHRDDWVATLGNRKLGEKGSQGENRSGVIALKSVQVKIYRDEKGFSPIFLLDDVASELDSHRSDALFKTLLDSAGQVFLTTVEPGKIFNNFKVKEQAQGASFLVEEGRIKLL